MGLKALFYAYLLGGVTFIPLLFIAAVYYAYYTSIPVEDTSAKGKTDKVKRQATLTETDTSEIGPIHDVPRPRKGWLTMRRTFEPTTNGTYVGLITSFLDSRSKDPKRSRPKDMWYAVLKGKILYLYEDDAMLECEAVLELSMHEVFIYPKHQIDGELFAKRHCICLTPKQSITTPSGDAELMPSVTKEMKMDNLVIDTENEEEASKRATPELKKSDSNKTALSWFSSKSALSDTADKMEAEEEKRKKAAKEKEELQYMPWFIFPPTNIETEDWYFAFIHASENPANSPTLDYLSEVYKARDVHQLVKSIDEQPDVIPMRWLNALIGRIFYSYYRTHALEDYIIRQMMRKISKVKKPSFLSDIVVTEVSVGTTAPTFSKPMLKELTKEGDAAMEVHLRYKGEVRVTIEATAVINLGARFKSYTVHLVLAAILREIEGNLLVKIKRPPSSRIWYGFTQPPRMVLDVEPVVSDRQLTWTMILNTIKSKVEEIILESMVLPNMDDISFFDSSSKVHRGGIWNDAARRERIGIPLPTNNARFDQPDDSAPVSGGTFMTPDVNVVPSTPVGETEASVSRKRSSDQLDNWLDPSNTASGQRRASLFGTSNATLKTMVDTGLELSDSDDSSVAESTRGRTISLRSTANVRSRSIPNDVMATPVHGRIPSMEQAQSKSAHKRRLSTRSEAESFDITENSSAPFVETSPRTLFSASSLSRTKTDASPNSFLATLRSRAAATDKQTISNQARDAIRKWGVNWGANKRDSGTGFVDTNVVAEQRSRGASTSSQSYVEARSAHHGSQQNSAPGTPPIAIPTSDTRSRTLSGHFGNSPVQTSSGSSSYTPALHRQSEPKILAPVVSHATTETSHGATRSIDSADGFSKIISTKPVHTQPLQARSMMIPGIHASHKGDLQSMGYVVPQPITDSKPVAAVLPNVYKLWRGNAPQSVESAPSISEPMSLNDGDVQDSLPAVSLVPIKRVPPPLPARKNSSLLPEPVETQEVTPLSAPAEISAASAALQRIVSQDSLARIASSSPEPPSPTTSSQNSLGALNKRSIPASSSAKPNVTCSDPITTLDVSPELKTGESVVQLRIIDDGFEQNTSAPPDPISGHRVLSSVEVEEGTVTDN